MQCLRLTIKVYWFSILLINNIKQKVTDHEIFEQSKQVEVLLKLHF